MTVAEIIEDIRTLLREPQVATVPNPHTYTDTELYAQLRSALRHLRALGVESDAEIDLADGTLTGTISEPLGVLLSLHVARNLLQGDLVRRLQDGDLGIYWKEEGTVVDTKNAANQFRVAGDRLEKRYRVLYTRILSGDVRVGGDFGGALPGRLQ